MKRSLTAANGFRSGRFQTNQGERTALEAFEGRELLYLTDIPPGIEKHAIERLIERNVVQVVELQNTKSERLLALRMVH